jgi:hypothetical protein
MYLSQRTLSVQRIRIKTADNYVKTMRDLRNG